ncbi:MAG: hypothetical protein KUA35_11130 [Pseudodesulfovibrio sp.]|uniref:CULT domain-containing protein n=1 Tax=Pseudodesulfovibrio aespoeensis (strain ATCC 700646 / DSM 10631 / Aspo-2) TaxID=643562 RepID=E6VTZ0_PSEA9|nr:MULTISPECIES: cereblon family protein [Pseudodesulfovibrio]MBU4192771.1 hypothetical protein [Pseudomonadota bacterium]ADU61082.1 hypothetical protein Daes_0053 [Pseudodesulfovibrio aespoeensis Aspo-2]MBU4244101.1 hypothetical protein [Pseudomonadota bacterium]MBU4379312.1 hypothetical protein [Pseudomonadota bacterium]MBU4476462.1 hypothetical protein [Pseudomonadota bacterium]
MRAPHHHTARTATHPPSIFKNAPGKDRDPNQATPDNAPDPGSNPGTARPVLVCRTCRTMVTRPELSVEVDGSHRHVFFNPHGLVFDLGCFASARNVLPTGPKTDEFTWFAGYAWQAVVCAGCAGLLGWRYTGQGHAFFGLILPALIEADEDHS